LDLCARGDGGDEDNAVRHEDSIGFGVHGFIYHHGDGNASRANVVVRRDGWVAVDGPLDAAVCNCVGEGRGDLGYLLSGGEILVPVERVCEGHLGMFAVLEGVGGYGCAEVGNVGAPFQS